MESGVVQFIEYDGENGYSFDAPYDVINVGGACLGVPDEFIRQLKVGGTMLVPLGRDFTTLYIVERLSESKIKKTSGVVYDKCPPLTTRDRQLNKSSTRRKTIYLK